MAKKKISDGDLKRYFWDSSYRNKRKSSKKK